MTKVTFMEEDMARLSREMLLYVSVGEKEWAFDKAGQNLSAAVECMFGCVAVWMHGRASSVKSKGCQSNCPSLLPYQHVHRSTPLGRIHSLIHSSRLACCDSRPTYLAPGLPCAQRVRMSMRRMGVSHIDLLQLHWWVCSTLMWGEQRRVGCALG